MVTNQTPRPSSTPTLRAALAGAIRDARSSGAIRLTLMGTYVYVARAVLRLMPDMARRPIGELDEARVRRLVRECIERELSPRTIARSYLWLLQRCFDLLELPSPIPDTKRRMRALLRAKLPPAPFFAADELHAVLDRVASYESRRGRALPTRARDLALFRLAAFRGIRSGELTRIRIDTDIDWTGSTVAIISKDREAPRRIDLSPALMADIRTLCAGRRTGTLVPAGLAQLNTICERWKRRLDEPRLNMRTLRRSFASALDAQGAPLGVVRDALGHVRDSRQTLRYIGSTRRRRVSEYERLEHGSDPLLA